jgi:hypothetical protein
MDSITNTNTDDLQVSEPWFQVMDPICLDNICENDLEQWSIRKRSEEYLPVHQEGPFPLTGNDCFSSERVRDSIYLYKLRMARHHDVEPQTPKSSSKLIKFDTTCFGSSAPSSARLSKQLKTYRQKLAEKPSERTSDTLLDLEAELSATFDLVRQKLREQEITPSDTNPASALAQAICRRKSQERSPTASLPQSSATLHRTSPSLAPKPSQRRVGHQPPNQSLLPKSALSSTDHLDRSARTAPSLTAQSPPTTSSSPPSPSTR